MANVYQALAISQRKNLAKEPFKVLPTEVQGSVATRSEVTRVTEDDS